MKQALNKIVTGEDFFDRDKDFKLFIERIDAGAHQLQVGTE